MPQLKSRETKCLRIDMPSWTVWRRYVLTRSKRNERNESTSAVFAPQLTPLSRRVDFTPAMRHSAPELSR